MGLTIYGSPRSRTMRVLWTAEELALEYLHLPYEWQDPYLKSAEFLRVNPCGAIPAIVDDGVAMAESLAINLYLCQKYGARVEGSLAGTTPDEAARIWQWSLWVQGHIEPWVQRDAALAGIHAAISEQKHAVVGRALEALEQLLARSDWLVGSRFTCADLNVAGVLSPSRAASVDVERYPHVAAWLARCYTRPAALRVRERFGSGR
jgi:glutathione S-transferase